MSGVLILSTCGLSAIENNKKPALKQATHPVEDVDDLVQASSFTFGVGTKTLRVVEQQVGNGLKEVTKLHIAINGFPQKLKEVGSTLIKKTFMGVGFLLSIIALYEYLGRHHHQDPNDQTKTDDKNKTATNLPGAIIGGLVALGCGYFLMH
jgi:hypothetical protein